MDNTPQPKAHPHEGPVFEKPKIPLGYCQNPFVKEKCIHSSSEYYCIEDGNDCDSGYDYFCNHPSVGKKATPAHHGEVPNWCPCASHTSSAQERIDAIPDTLKDLQTTAGLLYEFCEWFCDYDCEEKSCTITVSGLHERLEGIKKQMEEHPEYLAKWNVKRAEQKALLQAGRK